MKKLSGWDTEDEMFEMTLEHLDKIRQPLHSECGRLIAHFVDISKRDPIVRSLIDQISANLEGCERILGGISPERMENVLSQLVLSREKLGKLEDQVAPCMDSHA